MKKHNIVLLYKNGQIKVTKKESDMFDKGCKYALIPVLNYNSNTFIMIKPSRLLQFTSIEIEYGLVERVFVDTTSEDKVEGALITKTVTSIVEIINFLNSIDRIDFVNHISNYYMSDYNEILDIYRLSIKIFNDNDITFMYDYVLDYEEETDCTTISNYETIIKEIKGIYNTRNKDLKSDFINIKNNRWEISKHIDKDAVIGINLPETQSLYFMLPEQYEILNHIATLKCEAIVFNRDDYYEDCRNKSASEEKLSDHLYEGNTDPYLTFDFGEVNPQRILEFFLYLNLIETLIIMRFNIILYEVYKDRSVKFGFDLFLKIIIINQYTKKDIEFEIVKDRIPTIDEIFKEIYIKWSD